MAGIEPRVVALRAAAAVLCLLVFAPGLAAPLPPAAASGGNTSGREFEMPKRPPIPAEVLVDGEAPAATDSAPPTPQGPRIFVRRLELAGVEERPENGIRVADLQALVDRLLAERLAAAGVAPDAEASEAALKQELQRLIDNMQKPQADSEPITPEALQRFIDKLRVEQQQAELGIDELQGIAAEVARYYRRHGLILAQAYIPPQTIRDGVVTLRVVEGRLGQVLVEKPRRYTVAQLTQPFVGQVGQPVARQRVEEALLLLSDYPGLRSFGVFRPGSAPGTTDLVVSVLEERRVEGRLHADNYGSQYTGEYRARADLVINNPFKAQDRLFAHISRTFQPDNGLYGGLGYERSAFGPRNTFGASYLDNVYDMGGILEPFGLTGSTRVVDVYWRRQFVRGPRWNSFGTLRYARKSVTLDVTEGRDTADELSVFSAEFGFDRRSADGRGYQSGGLQLSQGVAGILGSMAGSDDPNRATANRRGGSGKYASSQFSKLSADYQYWYDITPTHGLRLVTRGQYSADLLTSIEQFSMGGPGSVRAYANAEYLADTGYSLSLEWLLRAPGFAQWPAFAGKRWGEILQFVLFADSAQGWLNDPLASDRDNVSLHGVGGGVRIHAGGFSMRLEIATPVGDETASNGRDPQYFFEFNYAL